MSTDVSAPAAKPNKKKVAPKAGAKVAPTPTKKVAAKKAPVQKKDKAEKGEGKFGIERDADLPWCDKKVALFKALKALKAVSEGTAKTATEIVEKTGDVLDTRFARHYAYHAKSAGLIEVVKVEGVSGYSFYLTAAGAKLNPDAELKAQAKAKAE